MGSAGSWATGSCTTAGAITSGSQYQFGYYAAIGTTISGLSSVTTDSSGDLDVTSTTTKALAVGANGATNPVLAVDANTASVVTGVAIKGAATGGTTTLLATDSGSNSNLQINAKGSGLVTIGTSALTNSTDIFANQMILGVSSGSGMYFQSNSSTVFFIPSGAANVTFYAPIKLPGYTVSGLPTGSVGDTAYVTDATTCTKNGALTGSGSTACVVWYNGSAWVGE
jgi:hypothetical protein